MNNQYQVTGLERHKFAPELNTIVLVAESPETPVKRIKVGFFGMNYNPTFQQAINYAYSEGMLNDEDIEVYNLRVESTSITHNEAYWQGKTHYIHPITGTMEPVGYKVMKNYSEFHQNIR